MKFGKRAEAPAKQDSPDRFAPQAVAMSSEASHNARLAVKTIVDSRQMDIEELATAYQQTSNDPLQVGGPMPPSIGRCADLYSDVRSLRLAMDKEVEAVKARENQIREHIIANLSKSLDTGASGLRYRAQIVNKEVPRPMDWAKIHAYIAKNNRFDLLQKRLGEKAVMDMYEDKQLIPGIEIVKVPEVSITKIGR